MNEPSARQVLYALVASGLHVVVAVLILAAAPLVPWPWTALTATVWALALGLGALRWRRTRVVLMASIGTFVVWTVGTLLVRNPL